VPAFETKQVKFTRLALLPILMLGLSGTLLADSPSGQVKKLLPLLQTAKQDTRLQAVTRARQAYQWEHHAKTIAGASTPL
jgi:hypothetical protein